MLGRFLKKQSSPTDAGERIRTPNDKSNGKTNQSGNDGILGFDVETMRDNVAEIPKNSHLNARAGMSLLWPNGEARLIDKTLDEFRQIGSICPTSAVTITGGSGVKNNLRTVALDNGKCFLCGRCQEVFPHLVRIESVVTPPVRERQRLIATIPHLKPQFSAGEEAYEVIGDKLKVKIANVLGRSLAIRQVDAGSCNGCEIEITALNNPIYDVERFGIHFVASPRHADALLVTGPASRNMELALRRTYDATPDPKIVIAIGACACSGGIFGDTYATTGGIERIVPVDVFVPGCPPRPEALLYGLLMALDRIGPGSRRDE